MQAQWKLYETPLETLLGHAQNGNRLCKEIPGRCLTNFNLNILTGPVTGGLEKDERVAARAPAPATLSEPVYENLFTPSDERAMLHEADLAL